MGREYQRLQYTTWRNGRRRREGGIEKRKTKRKGCKCREGDKGTWSWEEEKRKRRLGIAC